MSKRDAVDTLKGYFYQFDYSINTILKLPKDSASITIEGIEDIDIDSENETTAIQCKYYSKTEYNHSVISKPIRFMLEDFSNRLRSNSKMIKYHIYGNYKSGQEKLKLPISINFLKENFLTYTKDKTTYEYHNILKLDDTELCTFLTLLTINNNAIEYDIQFKEIIKKISKHFSCDDFESEYYYYNNAINEIKNLAIESNINKRQISKKEFLSKIDKKQLLFNKWFVEYKSKTQYFRKLKDQYFRRLNKSPFERFFIVNLINDVTMSQLKELVLIISDKYSNIKKREPETYCPYVFFNNLSAQDLLHLKNELYNENFRFIDGIPFLGSTFQVKSITTKANYKNKLKIKILNNIDDLKATFPEISKTKEIYQFYFDEYIKDDFKLDIKKIDIQISNIEDIKEII